MITKTNQPKYEKKRISKHTTHAHTARTHPPTYTHTHTLHIPDDEDDEDDGHVWQYVAKSGRREERVERSARRRADRRRNDAVAPSGEKALRWRRAHIGPA
jgi:hypothetical protein